MKEPYERLLNIKYQIIQDYVMDDAKKVEAARSLLDAVINSGTVIPEGVIFPDAMLGVSVEWSEDNKSITLSKNGIIIEDNLGDIIVPSLDEFENYLSVNGEFLMVNDDYLLVA